MFALNVFGTNISAPELPDSKIDINELSVLLN